MSVSVNDFGAPAFWRTGGPVDSAAPAPGVGEVPNSPDVIEDSVADPGYASDDDAEAEGAVVADAVTVTVSPGAGDPLHALIVETTTATQAMYAMDVTRRSAEQRIYGSHHKAELSVSPFLRIGDALNDRPAIRAIPGREEEDVVRLVAVPDNGACLPMVDDGGGCPRNNRRLVGSVDSRP